MHFYILHSHFKFQIGETLVLNAKAARINYSEPELYFSLVLFHDPNPRAAGLALNDRLTFTPFFTFIRI